VGFSWRFSSGLRPILVGTRREVVLLKSNVNTVTAGARCKSSHCKNLVNRIVKMAKKLYVGNLSFSMTDDGLREAFAQVGEVVSAMVIKDKMTGRSRGFGFVEMAADEAAMSAIETLNGKEVDGRTLVVNEAKPMTDRPAGGGSRGGFNRGGGFGGGRSDY